MTADASLIPDGAQVAFTLPNGHEQIIVWSDLLAILDARVAAAQAAGITIGITADVGSIQGGAPITTIFNVYDTVAVAGDAATLPAVFLAGDLVYVKNDAAVNSMDVFPALGDDAGAGDDTAIAVAAGEGKIFLATVDNTTWTVVITGA